MIKKQKMQNLPRVFSTSIVAIFVAAFATGCPTKQQPTIHDVGAADGSGSPVYDGSGIGDDAFEAQSSYDQFEETGTVVAGGIYEDIRFAYDSDRLDGVAMDAVRHNASILNANESFRLEIEGHCDERGSSEYNLALGARRARTVKQALIGLGVDARRLSTVSYGEELPLCTTSNEACWASNRRAHLVDLDR